MENDQNFTVEDIGIEPKKSNIVTGETCLRCQKLMSQGLRLELLQIADDINLTLNTRPARNDDVTVFEAFVRPPTGPVVDPTSWRIRNVPANAPELQRGVGVSLGVVVLAIAAEIYYNATLKTGIQAGMEMLTKTLEVMEEFGNKAIQRSVQDCCKKGLLSQSHPRQRGILTVDGTEKKVKLRA